MTNAMEAQGQTIKFNFRQTTLKTDWYLKFTYIHILLLSDIDIRGNHKRDIALHPLINNTLKCDVFGRGITYKWFCQECRVERERESVIILSGTGADGSTEEVSCTGEVECKFTSSVIFVSVSIFHYNMILSVTNLV